MTTFLRSASLLVLLAACAGKTVDDPRIEVSDVGFALHLPPAMQHALDAFAPGFRAVRGSSFRSDVSQAASAMGSAGMPAVFAALRDFDHDGTIDAVVEGTTPGDSALRVIVVMNGAKPTAAEVMRFAEYDADAVGIYLSLPPKGVGGAFEVVAYPDSSTVFSFAGGGFQGRKLAN